MFQEGTPSTHLSRTLDSKIDKGTEQTNPKTNPRKLRLGHLGSSHFYSVPQQTSFGVQESFKEETWGVVNVVLFKETVPCEHAKSRKNGPTTTRGAPVHTETGRVDLLPLERLRSTRRLDVWSYYHSRDSGPHRDWKRKGTSRTKRVPFPSHLLYTRT